MTDAGGLDILAGQQAIPLGMNTRNKFNARFQIAFDGSMFVLTPVLAAAAFFVALLLVVATLSVRVAGRRLDAKLAFRPAYAASFKEMR